MSETSISSLLGHLPASQDVVPIHNPTNGKKVYGLPQLSASQVETAVTDARLAQKRWSEVSPAERAQTLLRTHDLLMKNQDRNGQG
jgi:acyl-CoA reductase-like NAD-dependent aldehyde dehydrogenase